MLLKTWFLLPHLFCNVEFEFSANFTTANRQRFYFPKIEMLLWFQNKKNIKIIVL